MPQKVRNLGPAGTYLLIFLWITGLILAYYPDLSANYRLQGAPVPVVLPVVPYLDKVIGDDLEYKKGL